MTATDSRRVIYNVLEYSPLCDSSNMTMDDWIHIANDIKVKYKLYIYAHKLYTYIKSRNYKYGLIRSHIMYMYL